LKTHKLEEYICDQLLINLVIGVIPFQHSQSFTKVVIQCNCFMSKLPDKKIFLLDFLLKWQDALKVLFGSGQIGFRFFGQFVERLAFRGERRYLRLGVLDNFP
jgi:hypothetical protein